MGLSAAENSRLSAPQGGCLRWSAFPPKVTASPQGACTNHQSAGALKFPLPPAQDKSKQSLVCTAPRRARWCHWWQLHHSSASRVRFLLFPATGMDAKSPPPNPLAPDFHLIACFPRNPVWEWLLLFSRQVRSDSLPPHGLQHAKPPCASPTPRIYSNSCPLSRWLHPTISSSIVPFSSRLQSFPASGSFPMSQFFPSGGQRIGVSASASLLPMNIQDWFPLGWTGWIPMQSKGLSGVFSNTTVQKHQFFGAQVSLLSNSHIHTWLLEKPQPWLDGPLLAK